MTICRIFLFFFCTVSLLWAVKPLPNQKPDFERSTGLKQLEKILKDLKKAMGDIPPEVEKIAIYQIRTDSRDFSRGVAQYLQGRIETTFRDEARLKLISPPELKTLTIVSTDSSFSLTNTVPTLGELWKLGDKLRIDAFIEGTCGKSEEGDVMLNLKLIKHRSAEILWSGDFIAGPNKVEAAMFDLKWTLALPVRIFPVAEFYNKDSSDVKNPGLSQFAVEVSVSEALLKNKQLYFTAMGGFSWTTFSEDAGVPLQFKRLFTMQLGVELLAVIAAKQNPERGYWLGSFIGGRYFVPFSFTGSIPVFTVGFRSQLSRQFGARLGFLYLAGNRAMSGTGTSPNTRGVSIDLESFAYEFDVVNFTF